MEHVVKQFHPLVSQRRACQVISQPRSTQLRPPQTSSYEAALVARRTALACAYGRYGYRRITALLREEQWWVNHKRVERLWRLEGLKVPQRQPKRKRLWFQRWFLCPSPAGTTHACLEL